MIRLPIFLLTALTLLGADNPWAKVQDLKSGAELRIYKKGTREPVAAKFDEANEERMVVVVKNQQIAIRKDDIDRVDARPVAKAARKMSVETTTKATEPDYTPHPNSSVQTPGTSSSSNVSFGSGKGDFETVYRRTAPVRSQENRLN